MYAKGKRNENTADLSELVRKGPKRMRPSLCTVCEEPSLSEVHVPLESSTVIHSSQQTSGGRDWQTPYQVIPVDTLLHKKRRGNSEKGQREAERESDCFRNEWRQCFGAKKCR